MYLSRVELDVNNRQKIRDLTHVGAYHSWVEDSFPEEVEHNVRSRKLWRLDSLQKKTFLLIVSPNKPDLVKLEKYGVCGTAATKDYDPFLASIHTDGIYQFRAVLNPVHSAPVAEGVRGRVFPEVTAGQQLAYLERKAVTNGFELLPNQYRITERKYVLLRKTGQQPLHLCQAAYEGILRVKDENTFRTVLCQGIGRKKAYGFGMMTVIPVR
jgi:CRISPR system Cascade subunit CasE